MGGGETSQAVGRFNSDPHFMVGIRRVVRRCPRGATTGGHDLYVIGALGHQLAHRRPNRVLAIRLAVAEIEVTLTVSQRPSSQE